MHTIGDLLVLSNVPSISQLGTVIRDFNPQIGITPLTTPLAPVAGIICYFTSIAVFHRHENIHIGPDWDRIMAHRKRFNLKIPLAIHNAVLCAFSFITLVGLVLSLAKEAASYGFVPVYCTRNNGESWFWCYLFYLSKYYELLDTVFILLRKNKLTFLHCVHHTLVLPLFWVYFHTSFSGQWVFIHMFLTWWH